MAKILSNLNETAFSEICIALFFSVSQLPVFLNLPIFGGSHVYLKTLIGRQGTLSVCTDIIFQVENSA